MRIAIRCDASTAIGGGHVMRCLTLAEALSARGAQVLLLVNADAPATAPTLTDTPFSIVAPGPEATVAAIRAHWPEGADWTVIDHYGWSAGDETALRVAATNIMALDDRPTRAHAVDLLLDPTPGRDAVDWSSLAPGATVLAGAAHALIGPAWRAARADPPAASRSGVVIALGLSDTGDLPDAIAAALSDVGPLHLVGPASATAPGVIAHDRLAPPALADLLARCAVAVGAGGSSALERAYLGVPSVIAVIADNQRDLAAGLAEAGAALACPPDAEAVAAGVRALLADPAALAAMSARTAALVDGRGPARVAAAILGADKLLVRPAEPADARNLWLWRNDPATRAASRASDPIGWDEHRAWFARALTDPHRTILIGELGGEPVGMVRFDQRDAAAEVSIALAPERRGGGLGANLLSVGIARMQVRLLLATVHADNTASRRLFAGVGFRQTGSDGGWLQLSRDVST
jgi:UDP-2,4-diacetamido-2,4,6-trideoxy-beta-L-altropyranose hydrolase